MQSETYAEYFSKYDAAYFEDQILLLISLKKGRASDRMRVSVAEVVLRSQDGAQNLSVTVDATLPDTPLGDETVNWCVILEPESGVDVASQADVSVEVNMNMISADEFNAV